MTYSEPARTAPRRLPRILLADLLVVVAAIAAAFAFQLPASSFLAGRIIQRKPAR